MFLSTYSLPRIWHLLEFIFTNCELIQKSVFQFAVLGVTNITETSNAHTKTGITNAEANFNGVERLRYEPA